MTVHKCTHKCNCSYVPPHVLDRLARAGVEEARLSVQQSELTRQRRRNTTIPMDTFIASAASGITASALPAGIGAKREVWDSGQTWSQRVNRVRGEGDPVTGDDSVDCVHEFAGYVRDFYATVLNRNSIDNQGMDIVLNVHFGISYMNAFWDGDEMTFGDGNGVIFGDFTKSLDVVAHELTHGVTQHTANLNYFSQSGALNEHFSDVFGAVITQYVKGQTADEADWLVGDEIMGPSLYGEALRSMKAPGTAYDNPLLGKDPQPDHMSSYYFGPNDNQGVHINSGIPNKAFYLTAMDIGTDKAGLIWYTGLQKLWATAVFNDAVDVLVEAARLLVKTGQVPAGSPQVVRAAFKAVGLS
jgi:Zn-dependent metalloprotease